MGSGNEIEEINKIREVWVSVGIIGYVNFITRLEVRMG